MGTMWQKSWVSIELVAAYKKSKLHTIMVEGKCRKPLKCAQYCDSNNENNKEIGEGD